MNKCKCEMTGARQEDTMEAILKAKVTLTLISSDSIVPYIKVNERKREKEKVTDSGRQRERVRIKTHILPHSSSISAACDTIFPLPVTQFRQPQPSSCFYNCLIRAE